MEYWILFFYQSPKTFCIKSKIFVLVQNKFGPIKDRASNWIFLHRYNFNLTSKNNLFHFITTPPQRICIRFKSGLFTNYVSIHKKAYRVSRIRYFTNLWKNFFLTSNQKRLKPNCLGFFFHSPEKKYLLEKFGFTFTSI